ncbi:hypothetical protein BZA05DRAFT_432645 [Tricharina praecox]|uniref:uncharacterized protein n=1 Tax=Tricharina praecox TaxID=43433 RepID=UPI002220CDAD|nr:uncharacterized protein BZA05DRAFT_432645 [Tricharina praecox]KAI5858790.1 hypothetical protein BZA05DRAFT_432645 [Tricharina praecox]
MPIKLHRDQFRWTNGRGHDQKPVLYSQKANQHGLGKKEHNADDWWAKAFDNQLKSLDVCNSSTGEVTVKQTKMTATPIGMHIANRYYIKFVPGGVLKGDVETAQEEAAAAAAVVAEEKRAQEKKDKKARKEKKDKKSSRSSRESTADGGRRKEKKQKKSKVDETRDERKEKRRLKRLLEKEMALLQMTATEA